MIKETCSCGATVEIRSTSHSAEQYAVARWRDDHQHEHGHVHEFEPAPLRIEFSGSKPWFLKTLAEQEAER